jgi:hypothetical protein
MDRYEEPFTSLNIAFHSGLSLDIIIVRYEGPLTPITIAFHRRIYLDIVTY